MDNVFGQQFVISGLKLDANDGLKFDADSHSQVLHFNYYRKRYTYLNTFCKIHKIW